MNGLAGPGGIACRCASVGPDDFGAFRFRGPVPSGPPDPSAFAALPPPTPLRRRSMARRRRIGLARPNRRQPAGGRRRRSTALAIERQRTALARARRLGRRFVVHADPAQKHERGKRAQQRDGRQPLEQAAERNGVALPQRVARDARQQRGPRRQNRRTRPCAEAGTRRAPSRRAGRRPAGARYSCAGPGARRRVCACAAGSSASLSSLSPTPVIPSRRACVSR